MEKRFSEIVETEDLSEEICDILFENAHLLVNRYDYDEVAELIIDRIKILCNC
jgi:hypothetical protein